MPIRRYNRGGYSGAGDLDIEDIYEGGYTPWQQSAQLALSRRPEAFNYSSLEEKYPTKRVMPIVPSYIQNQIDEDSIARKSNEVALRVREAQLNNYDSELNAKRAIADQTIAARPVLAQLNPKDPDFLDKLDKVFIDFPQLEQNQQLMSGQVARLVNTHNRYMSKIKPQTSESAYKDYEDAYKNVISLRQAKDKAKGEYTKEDEIFESLQVQKMDQALSRIGSINQSASQQQGIPKPSIPSNTSALNFNTPEEANEAERNGLIKSGDRITVGGRPAIVK